MKLNEKEKSREKLLMNALGTKHKLEINDVMEMLDVSKSTARRILMQLEAKGLLVRTHGGAHLLFNDYSLELKSIPHITEKKRIGEYACSLIKPDDIIYIDSGTTSQCFALVLAEKIKSKQIVAPIIFTNSIVNVDILSEVAHITLIGGEGNPMHKAFFGYLAKHCLEILHFTKCFLSTDSIDAAGRLYASNFPEAEINKAASDQADRTILMCDHSKFSQSGMAQWSTLQKIDLLIVDDGIDPTIASAIESLDCKIVKV